MANVFGWLSWLFQLPSSYNQCDQKFRNSIAKEFTWRNIELAVYIGLQDQDATNIQQQFNDPVERRIQLLKIWSERLGSRATYRKLSEGFKEIGRMDIAEFIERKHPLGDYLLIYGIIVTVVVVALLMLPHAKTHFTDSTDSTNISKNVPVNHSLDVKPPAHNQTSYEHNPWNVTNCEYGKVGDLPTIPNLFVDREENISYIIKLLLTNKFKRIINICGAPGFGKSALAIQVGHKLVSECIYIRYIDTTEHHLFKQRVNQAKSTTYNDDIRHTKLQDWRKSQVGQYHTKENKNPQSHTESGMWELLEWARSVEKPILLILDNSDEILHSVLRDDFIELIKQIGQIHLGYVKIIVTSQEKLLLHNNFVGLEIQELKPFFSIVLLMDLVPNITSHDAEELADIVGGSPLALTIIGRIINDSGSGLEIIPTLSEELKTDPLKHLDTVSDKKSKFRGIMDTAWSYIDKTTQVSALYLSYFPGSFDMPAKNKVLSLLTKTQNNYGVENLERQSLLQQYFLNRGRRFKMHKLIREYFREKENSKNKGSFDQAFTLHFTEMVLNYTVLYVRHDINIEEASSLLTESHNIVYLSKVLGESYLQHLGTLMSKETLDRFIALTKLFSEPLVLYSKDVIKQIFLWAISENAINFINETLKCNDTYVSFYKEIIENTHKTLCELKDDQTGDFDILCELLQCNITMLTAPLCENIQSEVCTQVVSLNQMCFNTFSNICWHTTNLYYQNLMFFDIIKSAAMLFSALTASTIVFLSITVIIEAIHAHTYAKVPQYCIVIIAVFMVFFVVIYPSNDFN